MSIIIRHPYLKLGRISASRAKKAHIVAGDVYVSENHLTHISNNHAKELDALGLTALALVKLIMTGYNQIRKGSGDSILLVVFDEGNESHNTMAVSLNYSLKKGFWEVKTAQPRKTKEINKKSRLW